MLVTVSVRVSVPVITATNPPSSVAGRVIVSTVFPVDLVAVELELRYGELGRPRRSIDAPVELEVMPARLLRVLPALALLYTSRVVLGSSKTASSMQPLQVPGR